MSKRTASPPLEELQARAAELQGLVDAKQRKMEKENRDKEDRETDSASSPSHASGKNMFECCFHVVLLFGGELTREVRHTVHKTRVMFRRLLMDST